VDVKGKMYLKKSKAGYFSTDGSGCAKEFEEGLEKYE
jgi:hypothetical protein